MAVCLVVKEPLTYWQFAWWLKSHRHTDSLPGG